MPVPPRTGHRRLSEQDLRELEEMRVQWVQQDITGVPVSFASLGRRYGWKVNRVGRLARTRDWHLQRSQARAEHARNQRLAAEALSKEITDQQVDEMRRFIRDLRTVSRTGLRWAAEVLFNPEAKDWQDGKKPSEATITEFTRVLQAVARGGSEAIKLERLLAGEVTERVEHVGVLDELLKTAPEMAARLRQLADIAAGEPQKESEERKLALDEQEKAQEKEERGVADEHDTA